MLRISEDQEFYVDGEGQRYHRVSRVLRAGGVLRRYFGDSSVYRDRGRAVHRACELINKGILKETSVDPSIRPFVQAYRDFIRITGFIPIENEVMLCSIHGFAGTIDIVGSLNGRLVIVDIKTGESVDPAFDYQTGAYEILWNENNPDQLIQARYALQLTAGGQFRLKPAKTRPEAFLDLYQEFKEKTVA